MKHYVITMFNLHLRLGGGDAEKGIKNSFLEHRFKLFDKYTFPSMKNQTDQNFDWLVLFSDSTPAVFREKIKEYQKEMANFRPLFIKDEEASGFRAVLTEFIKNDTNENCIVTTRCDNDDSLNIKYIENVHKNIKSDSEYIISFPVGYQYDEKTEVLRKYYFPTSHFVTLVSNKRDKTVYNFLHMEIEEKCEVKFIKTEPMWLEVIHEENVYNCMGSIHFRDYVKSYDLENSFSIPLKAERSTASLFCLYIYFAFHKLYAKRKRITIAIKRKLKKNC